MLKTDINAKIKKQAKKIKRLEKKIILLEINKHVITNYTLLLHRQFKACKCKKELSLYEEHCMTEQQRKKAKR
jgi:hypothetical protein